MKTYFAIVHKDEDSAVGVVFPDLPGCFSAGDTFDKAIANAHVALQLYAEAELHAGRQLPRPRTFEALYRDREVREESKGAPFVGIRLEKEGQSPLKAVRAKSAVSRGRTSAGAAAKSHKRSRRIG
jgi:predicted RNase H-like HicB family nuclease